MQLSVVRPWLVVKDEPQLQLILSIISTVERVKQVVKVNKNLLCWKCKQFCLEWMEFLGYNYKGLHIMGKGQRGCIIDYV